MHIKNQITTTSQPQNSTQFRKQLGNVTYEVSVNFKQGATETLDQKIICIIKNELRAVQ